MLLDMVKQNEMIKDEDIGPYLPNNASVQEYDIWEETLPSNIFEKTRQKNINI